jgi:hypothetical protein
MLYASRAIHVSKLSGLTEKTFAEKIFLEKYFAKI